MYIKGFDENLCCRGMQYEVGRTYDISDRGELKMCSETALHFCDNILDVSVYYPIIDLNNRFCEVEPLGRTKKKKVYGVTKYASQSLRIIRELSEDEIAELYNQERCRYEDTLKTLHVGDKIKHNERVVRIIDDNTVQVLTPKQTLEK